MRGLAIFYTALLACSSFVRASELGLDPTRFSLAKRASVALSTYKGVATFYGNDGSGGNCKLPARSDLAFAAFPGAKWDSAAYCGACVRVKGPKGTVDVQITNKCPECPAGSLDLSKAAYSKIRAIKAGRIPITWNFINCKTAGLASGAVPFVWKSGSSQYWAGIQGHNAAIPIKSLSIRASSATKLTTLKREDFNYFVAPAGLGPGPFVAVVRYQNGSKSTHKGLRLNAVIGDEGGA
uniref:Expansin-like protein 1 n=1 Tax=Glaciozyma antarctica TaxID=105987 RepID=A0A650D9H7_9BASI|nr:expansin-like protein 1 [Glaciozyma antarctica]